MFVCRESLICPTGSTTVVWTHGRGSESKFSFPSFVRSFVPWFSTGHGGRSLGNVTLSWTPYSGHAGVRGGPVVVLICCDRDTIGGPQVLRSPGLPKESPTREGLSVCIGQSSRTDTDRRTLHPLRLRHNIISDWKFLCGLLLSPFSFSFS